MTKNFNFTNITNGISIISYMIDISEKCSALSKSRNPPLISKELIDLIDSDELESTYDVVSDLLTYCLDVYDITNRYMSESIGSTENIDTKMKLLEKHVNNISISITNIKDITSILYTNIIDAHNEDLVELPDNIFNKLDTFIRESFDRNSEIHDLISNCSKLYIDATNMKNTEVIIETLSGIESVATNLSDLNKFLCLINKNIINSITTEILV